MLLKIVCLALLGGGGRFIFPWKQPPSKTTISSNEDAAKSATQPPVHSPIRVLTWNILAPCYVKSPPPSWALEEEWTLYTDWAYRQAAIVDLISSSEADIVCLQEVQVSLCDEFERLLNAHGYDMHIQDTHKGHPVANVILLSKKRWKNNHWKVVHKESRSRALILALQEVSNETAAPPPIFVVNVHLQASRKSFHENAQTRFSQIQSLLKRVNLAWGRIRQEQQKNEENSSSLEHLQPSLLIMGDFNLSPEEPLYTLMSQGTWPADNRHFLPPKVSELTASSLPFLPLHDVRGNHYYASSHEKKPWTYPASLSVVDYIFASGHSFQTHSHQNYVPDCLSKKDGYRMTRSREQGTKPLLWPNEMHPSDHIPVGATLQIMKQPDGLL